MICLLIIPYVYVSGGLRDVIMHPQQQQPLQPLQEQSNGHDRGGLLTLHYGKHHASLVGEIRSWYKLECFADVVLICEGGRLKAHRLVLASASPLLRELLLGGSHTPPPTSHEDSVLVHLPGIHRDDVAHLLEFLYTGEACLRACEMERLHELVLLLGIDSELWDKHTSTDIALKEEELSSDDDRCSESSSQELSRLNNPVNLSLNQNRRSSPPPRLPPRRRHSADVASACRDQSPTSALEPPATAPAAAAVPANGDSAAQDRELNNVRVLPIKLLASSVTHFIL